MKFKKKYHNLLVWQKAHKFAIQIYQITKKFPKEEIYGLISQMRRAAYSVPANIVEGQARKSKKELLHFLNIAAASLSEVEYYLELSKDLKYISLKEYKKLEALRSEVGFLLHRFQLNL